MIGSKARPKKRVSKSHCEQEGDQESLPLEFEPTLRENLLNSTAPSSTMIELTVQELTWLNTTSDSPGDKCAHGKIRFSVNDVGLVSPTEQWTVSAAVIYFLRTLESDHNEADRVGEHLIPHCGHTMWVREDSDDVLIMGCDIGIDFAITRTGQTVTITADSGEEFPVSFNEYSAAVYDFSKAVRAFYDSSAPKVHNDDYDRLGFENFLSEWERRHPRETGK